MVWLLVGMIWLALGYAAAALLKNVQLACNEESGLFFDNKHSYEMWVAMFFGLVSLFMALIVAAKERRFGWRWWNPFVWVD